MTPTATIKKATRVQWGDKNMVSGEVHGDTKGRFPDGKTILTSNIVAEEGDIITTLNSVYRVEWAS